MKKGEHAGRKVKCDRGLYDFCEIEDTYGNRITVRGSSAADRCAWIFVKNRDGEEGVFHLGQWQSVSPHLNASQALHLAAALMRFADGPSRKERRARAQEGDR
jgi:hypothetical protein